MSAFGSPRLVDEAALTAWARVLADRLPEAACLHLRGELGAGKTTFARALIEAWQPGVRVRSPTYTLVERYTIGAREILHADLYRVQDPDELEALGLREAAGRALLLIEWPERGGSAVPPADLVIDLAHAGERRRLTVDVSDPPPSWLGSGAGSILNHF